MVESSYTEASSTLLGLAKSQVLPPLREVTLVHEFLPQGGTVVQFAGSDFIPQLPPVLFFRRNHLVLGNISALTF